MWSWLSGKPTQNLEGVAFSLGIFLLQVISSPNYQYVLTNWKMQSERGTP